MSINALDLLYRARQNKIDIVLVGEQLQVKVPRQAAINKDLLQELRLNKEELLHFLINNRREIKQGAIEKADRTQIDRIPLSFSQERLWFIDKLEGSSQYHIPSVLKIKGMLDVQALEQSLKLILDRHEVLRTVLLEENGAPYQFIKDSTDWTFSIIDGSKFRDKELSLAEYTNSLLSKPFNLAADYMLRASLITIEPEYNVLVLTIHHIASDGWSASVLVGEIVEAYRAIRQNRAPRLKPLNIQYADYALWQRNLLNPAELNRRLDYWRQKLSDAEILRLPSDFVRPKIQSVRGAAVHFSIDKDISAQIQQLSKQNGATVYMTLLAVFNILLYKYSGQQDIVVGSGIAGRSQSELEGLIGFFVNTLALRSQVNPEDTFTELLKQVKQTTFEAYEHQDTPFEKIVETIVETRDLGTDPLVQVVLVMQNTPELPALQLGEAQLSIDASSHTTALFELLLNIKETGQVLQGFLQYATDLYKAETIERMIGHFLQLIRSVLANPHEKISVYNILTANEKNHLLVGFNDAKAFYPKHKTLIQLFEEQVERTPGEIALVFNGERLTYGQVNERANQLAHLLKSKGCTADTLVPLIAERSFEMIIGLLGIMKAGGAYVPIDPDNPTDRISYLVNDTKSNLIVATASACKNVLLDAVEIVFIDEDKNLPQQPVINLPAAAESNNLAYVIYTSGSTGKPKGVLIEHRTAVNLISNQVKEFGISSAEKILQFSNYHFDPSVEQIFLALTTGAALVLIDKATLTDQRSFLSVIQNEGVTHLHGTPSFLAALQPAKYGSLKRVVSGGEACPLKLAESWSRYVDFYNKYGPTETTITVAEHKFDSTAKLTILPIGKPISNTLAYVVDPNGMLVPIGVWGELWVGGECVSRGYLNQPELTAEKFIKDPFATNAGARVYKTGDLVRWLSGGLLEFRGRADTQVKIRGYRIELGEVEVAVKDLGYVKANCAVAKKEIDGGYKLVDYYIPDAEKIKEKEFWLYPQRVSAWKEVHDAVYNYFEEDHVDPKYNFVGWNDSFTGKPIGYEQMRDWLKDIADVILATEPRNVLEIGSGSGLIYYQLADKVDQYIGADLSPSSIVQVTCRLDSVLTNNCPSTFMVAAAHEIELTPQQQIDTVIINSVIQYFPGIDYLSEVIEKAVSYISGAGTIIIGDVRDNRLLPLFKARLQLKKFQNTAVVDEFNWAVNQEVLKEEELCVSPSYFYALQQVYPRISHVQIQWKNSLYENELTLYRYTVLIYVGGVAPVVTPEWQNWNEVADKNIFTSKVQQGNDLVALQGAPNPRLSKELVLSAAIDDNNFTSVGEIIYAVDKENGLHQQVKKLLELAAQNGYACRYFVHEDPFLTNILLQRTNISAPIRLPLWQEHSGRVVAANVPLFNDISNVLDGEIKATLMLKLPEYYIPAEFVAIAQLPLTRNGKVNRQFLSQRHDVSYINKFSYQAPFTTTEKALAAIWSELLGVERIGIYDDFFQLGGHSLLAMRVISAIRSQLETELAIKDLFLHPTIAQLSQHLNATTKGLLLPSIQVQPRSLHIPLSFSQERLWFIDRLEGSIQYNMPTVLRIRGDLNAGAMEQTFQQIVNRHEVLRTTYSEADGKAYQVVKNKNEWQLSQLDGARYNNDTTGLQQFIQHKINTPFDLSNDYMLRATLIQLGEKEYVLILVVHHIASDGWSVSLMVKEVIALYKTFAEGGQSDLLELPLQYADYALWQRRFLEGEVLNKKLAYWRNKLQDVAPLQLPVDYVRTSAKRAKGAVLSFSIDKELTTKIHELSQKHGATIFMTLLAAFKVLLHRYTGQNDICVGSPVANRTQKEIEQLIGFFVNTLALRTNLDGNTSFVNLLAQVKQTTMEAYEHQEVPFEKIVDEVVKERDMLLNPLFQVMFVLQNTPETPRLLLEKVSLSREGHEHSTTLFDITFFVTEIAGALQVVAEYNTDLFAVESIQKMTGHFKELLSFLVKRPQQKIGTIPMLSETEQQQLLNDFNNTRSAYPAHLTVHELFEQQAAKTPGATAIVFQDISITYGDLNERSNRLAHYLHDKHIGNEQLVPICIERGIDMLVAILGVLKAGATFIPIDPEYPIERIAYMLEDCKATLALSSAASSYKLLGNQPVEIIELDSEWREISSKPATDLGIAVSHKHLAYVIYTSGSTGKPKGVMIEHQSVVNLLAGITRDVAFTPNSSFLGVTTFSFDICYLEFFVPLINGGKLIIATRDVAMDGYHLAKCIQQHQPTHLQGTPSTWQILLDSDWRNEENLTMLIGGEAVKDSLKNALTELGTVFNLYGPTETTIWSAIKKLETDEKVVIGKPIANNTIYILNEHQQLCLPKVAGEICVGGDGLARGYLNRPELTAEKFINNPFDDSGHSRLYKTGDLGRWRSDGNIEFLGRVDDQVKIRGYRIELGEIETVLQQSDIVNQSVVLAKEEGTGQKRLLSYYIPNRQVVKQKEKELYNNQLATWKDVYDIEYAQPANQPADEEFDINIWKNSFTGEPIASDQMHDWLDDITAIIFEQKPGNVLEIGSGSGLIYYQLAGRVDKYIGTDFSASSINQITQRIAKGLRDYGPTELLVCAAHDISINENQQVDTIIINSVVQYFPGEDYMTGVVEKSINILKGRGRIIIGDVRDNRLLHLFKLRLQMQKLQQSANVRELNWLTEQDVLKEEELCFDPAYFYHLQKVYPQISHVEIKWKKGDYLNELTLYRYNVVLHVGAKHKAVEPGWQNWNSANIKLECINQLEKGEAVVAIANAPNPRLWKEKLLQHALDDNMATTVGDLNLLASREDKDLLDIAEVIAAGKQQGYRVSFIMNDDPFSVHVLLEKNHAGRLIQPPASIKNDSNHFTNIPLFTDISFLLQKELRVFVKERLPEYMIPGEFIAISQLPLTNNGKTDRKFLSGLEDRATNNKLNYQAPASPVEKAITKIWEELLGVSPVGVYDNFFELGGHSLLAMRVIAAIRKQLQVEVAIRDLFLHPTVSVLAEHIQTTSLAVITPGISVQPRPAFTPLSFSQERLWFIDKFNGSLQYHIPAVLQLNGNLNKNVLENALRTVVERHEVLRTVIKEVEGKAYQECKPASGWTLAQIEWTNSNQGNVDDYINRIISQPFDLSADFMLRATLITLRADEFILVVTVHHISSDGWSRSIMVKEVAEIYTSLINGSVPNLPGLSIQYADYAIWQRALLKNQAYQTKINYWKDKLTGVETLQLPADFNRPAVLSTSGAKASAKIDASTVVRLKALGKQENCTLYMTMLAAFKIMLHLYSHQNDICVGTPIAGRTQQELEQLIGFFINSLALRTAVNSDETFTGFLQKVRTTVLEAFEHQEIPFEKVVDEVVLERAVNRNPIFQVMFVMLNMPDIPNVLLGDLSLSAKKYEHSTTLFDLQFFITENSGGLSITVEYATQLYTAATINNMLGHFKVLLNEVTVNPGASIGQLNMLTPVELKTLLQGFNDTATSFDVSHHVITLFQQQVAKTPQQVAVVFENESITYAELNQRSNQLAAYLIHRGVNSDSLVPICLYRSFEMIIGILGILKAGGAYVPIDPDYPADRIAYMLHDTNATFVLSSTGANASLVSFGVEVVELDTHWLNISIFPAANTETEISPSQLAYVIYTSGSTGQPKGAMNEHRGLTNRLLWAQDYFKLTADEVVLQKTTYTFDVSVWELLWPLIAGAKLVFAMPGGQKDNDYLKAIIDEQGITMLHFVPSMLAVFLPDINAGDCNTIQKVLCSGEALKPAHVDLFRQKLPAASLFNLYGPTEAAIELTCWSVPNTFARLDTVFIGRPVANTAIYIVDKFDRPVPMGVAGEILIGGIQVGRGYLNMPDLTAQKFVSNIFSNDGTLMYKTGDLGRWHTTGNIEYLGRIDDQVKVRGYRIEPGEIEAVLLQSKLVQQAVVIAKTGENGNNRLIAYLVQDDFNKQAVISYLRSKLPEYMVPAVWVVLRNMPLTSNGKIDKKALPEPGILDIPHDDYIAPSTLDEMALAEIWGQLLGVERIGINDNFFDLGGDSILTIQIISRINRKGYSLVPKDIFVHQTIARLAKVMTERSAHVVKGEQGLLHGQAGLLPIQHWYLQNTTDDVSWFNQSILVSIKKEVSPGILEEAIRLLSLQHDALRFSYHKNGDEWMQFYGPANISLAIKDLQHVEPTGLAGAITQYAETVQAALDIEEGKLAHATLVVTPGWESANRLLFVVHHLGIDGISWRILLEDLEALISSLAAGKSPVMGSKTSSYRQWFTALETYGKTRSLQSQKKYWQKVVQRYQPLLFENKGINLVEGIKSYKSVLSKNLTQQLLLDVPGIYHTEINDILLAGLAKTIADHFKTTAVHIGLESHGREHIADEVDISHTVGWFTTLYPLMVALQPNLHTGDVIKSVKEQLRQVPVKGLGFGILKYLEKDEKLQGSDPWDIIFNYLGQLDNVVNNSEWFKGAAESTGQSRSKAHVLHEKISLGCFIQAGELVVNWHYSSNHINHATIHSLAATYISNLQQIIEHCIHLKNRNISYNTPADYNLTGEASYVELDQFLNEKFGKQGRRELVSGIYRLSGLQQGMLFHSVYVKGTAAYINQFQCDLIQPNLQILQQSWQHIVEHHSILRTAFYTDVFSIPVQVVYKNVDMPVEVKDFSMYGPAEQADALNHFALEERKRGFDLTTAPLMRLALCRLNNNDYRMLWTSHHLLTDGWSIPILVEEFLTNYETLIRNEKVVTKAEDKYEDYIRFIETINRDDEETNWKRYLAAVEDRTLLPQISAAERLNKSGDYKSIYLRFSSETTLQVQHFAQRNRLTINTIMQGVHALLLHQYTGNDKVVFGITTSGRPNELNNIDQRVGMYINTLPLLSEFNEDASTIDWLHNIQAQQVSLRQYQYTMLSDIQKWTGIKGEWFDTTLTFQNFPVSEEIVSNEWSLKVKNSVSHEQNTYPLSLTIANGKQITVRIMYNANLLQSEVVEQLWLHFQQILKQVIATEGGILEDIRLLSTQDEQIL